MTYPNTRTAGTAQIVSLTDARAARRRRSRYGRLTRPLVAVWFGTAIFASVLVLSFAITVAMRAPAIGIPAGIAIATLASWPAAGAWLSQRRAGAARDAA